MSDTHDALRLAAPNPTTEPLRVNAYEAARSANAELVPLFPLLGPGAIVPAVSCIRSGQGYGRFFHRNSVDEVVVSLGGRGGMPAGILALGGRMHEVRPPDFSGPDEGAVLVITQRQAERGEQRESMIFRCEACNGRLFEFTYDASTAEGSASSAHGGRDDDAYRMFPTQWGAEEAAAQFNADDGVRRCGRCGHENEPFPADAWGWGSWVDRHRTVNAAHYAITDRFEHARQGRA